mmetsp:Transcript_117751/g.333767  ORF Transcript_117751/g.333767 Transcript_117751/m.333767 type:complete len:381 (-) Transcript_117751:16-1158(-)
MVQESRSWRIVDIGLPSSTHWVVHRLELYGRVAVDVGLGRVTCKGRLDGTSAAALYSGSLAARSSGSDPGSVFSGSSQPEPSWHSQLRDRPGEAWIGAEFPTPVLVRCLQIYQGQNESFHATRIALERLQERNGITGQWEGVTSWGDATNETLGLMSEDWLRLPVGLEWDVILAQTTQATSSTTALPRSGASTLDEPHAAAAAPEAWVWVLIVVLALAVNAACLACLWRRATGNRSPQQRVMPFEATKPPPPCGGGGTASDEVCVRAPRPHTGAAPEPPAADPSPLHLDPPGWSPASASDLRCRPMSTPATSSTTATSSTATSRGPKDEFGPRYSYPFGAPPSYPFAAPPSPDPSGAPLRHSFAAPPPTGSRGTPLRHSC